jgi:hypothetical protein
MYPPASRRTHPALRSLLLLVAMSPLLTLGAGDSASITDLKATGIAVNPWPQGGWKADVRSTTLLNETAWKALEAVPDLKGFSVGGDGFGDAELARLAKIRTVQRIFINGGTVTDDGLAVLAALPELHYLGFNHSTRLTASGLLALKDRTTLTAIEFGGCIIDDTGVKTIVQLTYLTELRIGHVRITRASLPLIAGLEHLEVLEITPNWDPRAYTAADLAALSRMKALRELEIHDMVLPYTDGLAQLVPITTLTKLKLYWCYVDPVDLQKFRTARPDVTLDVQNAAGEDKRLAFEKRIQDIKGTKP